MYRKGITLIELVVSMAIMIIVLTMVSSIFINSNKVYKTGISEVDMQNKIEKVMYNLNTTMSKAEDIKTGANIPADYNVEGETNVVYIKPKNMSGSDDVPPIVYYKISSGSGKYDLYERLYKSVSSEKVSKWFIDGSETDYGLIDSIYNFFLSIFGVLQEPDITDLSTVSLPSKYNVRYVYKKDNANYVVAYNTERNNQMCYFKMKQGDIYDIKYEKDYDRKIAQGLDDINIEKADTDSICNIKINYEIGSQTKTTETSVTIRNFGGM